MATANAMTQTTATTAAQTPVNQPVTEANTATSVELTEQVTKITDFPNYGMTWLIYIGLTLLLVGVIWLAFRKWHFILKWFMASTVFAGALTITHPAENTETYSPLILSAMVDLFDGNKTGFMESLKTIAMVWGIIFVAGLILWLLWTKVIKKSATPAEKKTKKSSEKPKKMATPIEPTLED